MIEISNLTKSYDGQIVIKNCNAKIHDGSINGLVGENGAGKSTLLRLIAGVLKADSGSIRLDGEEIFESPNAKSKIFFLADEPFYGKNAHIKDLTMLYTCFFDRFTPEEFKKNLVRYQVNIDKPLNSFSKGMRRKAYLAAALASHADIILIDEAFDGLDPYSRNEFKKDLIELIDKNPKTTVVIASHSLRELGDICDSYSLVDNGQISDDFVEAKNLHKVHLAFTDEGPADLSALKPLMVKRDGHFLVIVTDETEVRIRAFFSQYKPLMLDIVPLTVEEAFIYNKEREML